KTDLHPATYTHADADTNANSNSNSYTSSDPHSYANSDPNSDSDSNSNPNAHADSHSSFESRSRVNSTSREHGHTEPNNACWSRRLDDRAVPDADQPSPRHFVEHRQCAVPRRLGELPAGRCGLPDGLWFGHRLETVYWSVQYDEGSFR